MTPLRHHAETHPGLVHPRNEDAWTTHPLPGGGELLLVCDGMGGMGRGDVASQRAVQLIVAAFDDSSGTIPERLAHALRAADDTLREELCTGGEGWAGTTAALVHVQDDLAHVAWVGDSRIYLVRGGRVAARTRDHKLIQDLIDAGRLTEEEARYTTLGSVVTRAIGGRPPSEPTVEPELIEEPWRLKEGDRLVLCTDGLADLMSDEELPAILDGRSPELACEALVDLAVARGGHDNITVIVATYGASDAVRPPSVKDTPPATPAPRRVTLPEPPAPGPPLPLVVAGVLLLAALAWAALS